MISVYQLKPRFQNLLRPGVQRLYQRGITANQVTLAACLLSLLVGALVAGFASHLWLFALVPLWMFLRMALNAVDGMLAREFGQKSDLGAYLNELTDVIADSGLYLPFALLPGVNPLWVVLVVLLAVISEYAGALGTMVGASRRYDGPMGQERPGAVLRRDRRRGGQRPVAAGLDRLADVADRGPAAADHRQPCAPGPGRAGRESAGPRRAGLSGNGRAPWRWAPAGSNPAGFPAGATT
ncbi:CDP-alcohol phosphatidyltransferase [Pseudomonas aeruginosa]|nr:CDP-alcohol phosphatidyltransferase [Pseudomonas aeruginosa]